MSMNTVTIRSSQKIFTEEEVSGLTGICLDHLRNLARSKHLGFLENSRRRGRPGSQAEKLLFTSSDLMVLNVIQHRCQH